MKCLNPANNLNTYTIYRDSKFSNEKRSCEIAKNLNITCKNCSSAIVKKNKKEDITEYKSCQQCIWSTINTNDLSLICNLGITIKNRYTTAHNCQQYYKKTNNIKKKTPNIQLDLFIHQKL